MTDANTGTPVGPVNNRIGPNFGKVWVCMHPGLDSGIEGIGMLAVHPCSPKDDPDADPAHTNPDWGHKQYGCGWRTPNG